MSEIHASTYCVPQHPATNDGPDSDHFYAPLNIQESHNVYQPGTLRNPFYHVLEEPTADNGTPLQNHDGSTCFEQRVYNIAEEPSNRETTEGPAHHGAQPLYNVMEDPGLAGGEGPGH